MVFMIPAFWLFISQILILSEFHKANPGWIAAWIILLSVLMAIAYITAAIMLVGIANITI